MVGISGPVFFAPADTEHHCEESGGEDEDHAADRHEGAGREPEKADDHEDERDNDGDVATHRPILWVGDPRHRGRIGLVAMRSRLSIALLATLAALLSCSGIAIATEPAPPRPRFHRCDLGMPRPFRRGHIMVPMLRSDPGLGKNKVAFAI